MVYTWAVIGAGPAGIAAVGNLLDLGIPADKIIWVDPHFTVGDFGTVWRKVPSNTRVNLFLKFLYASPAFNFKNCPHDFALMHLDPESTCELSLMADPLQWVSTELKNKVSATQGFAEKLFLQNGVWHSVLKNTVIESENVILAQGSEPKTLHATLNVISLADAMNGESLKNLVTEDDTVAVFGSSHSAILAIRHLLEHKVKGVINFYRSPLRYAIYLPDEILFDDSGLKGSTADWARVNIDGELPAGLERINIMETEIDPHLLRCNKAIYAVGFERRKFPVIENVNHDNYLLQSGMIAPGLFGVGIAYPEANSKVIDIQEYRVGLWKFMTYLQKIIPAWIAHAQSRHADLTGKLDGGG